MRSLHTHYDNLKVPRDATPTTIRAAYRRLSQKHHPDRNPGDPEAARVMTLINVAYRVLSDPTKRADHDRWIARREAAAAPEQTPAGAHPSPPPPPPPPPRPARPSRPRKPKIDRSDIPEGLRQIARGAVFYVLTMLIFSPFLMTVAAWWKTPEPQPARAIPHTPQSNLLAPSRLAGTPQQLPDLSGVYRLIDSDIQNFNASPRVYSKGKLVIRKLNERAYVVLEAVTVRGARTFGYGHAYRIDLDETAPGKVTLIGRSGSLIIGDGERLVKHVQGANFKETLRWKREPAGFSEKYLDWGIEEAEWKYRLRAESGVEPGG